MYRAKVRITWRGQLECWVVKLRHGWFDKKIHRCESLARAQSMADEYNLMHDRKRNYEIHS